MATRRSIINKTIQDYRTCWKDLALTDVTYKIIAFVLLTPLVGIVFRTLLAFSGKKVLADQDILVFFLGPVGWICFILVGAMALGIVALEQTALIGILAASRGRQCIGVIGAVRFTSTNAWPVIQVTARIVAWTLLTLAPFLAVAGLTFLTLLTDYDINFYLKEKPPEFLIAVSIGGLLVIVLVAVLLRLLTSWFFALPLVLFEDIRPSNALGESRARVCGQRRSILLWIAGWLVATFIVSMGTTTLVIWLGRFFVPRATGSVALLTVAIGMALILWSSVGLAVNLLSNTTFAAMLFNLYLEIGSKEHFTLPKVSVDDQTQVSAGFKLTRMRLLAASIVGIILATGVGAMIIRSVHVVDNVAIMAHRGASAGAPENTMAAVKRAIEEHADWVEIDVQETADGEVVVYHDSDFKRLANVDLKIWDATMDDLKKIDIGSWFSPEFKDERVPTLADVLDVCRGKIGVNIELKYYGHDQQLEQRVADIVETHKMASNIILMSLKIDVVKKMKAIRPSWKVGLLMSVSAGGMKNEDVDFLAVNAAFVDRAFIQSAHKDRMKVYVWTVDDVPTMSIMIGRGVDALITNEPALARSVLEERARMAAPERLLLELADMFGVNPEIADQ